MQLLVVLGVFILFLGAESFSFKKKNDYVKRVECIYGFNDTTGTPQRSPKSLENVSLLYYQLDGKNDTVRYVWSFVGTPTLFMSVVPAGTAYNPNCNETKHEFDGEIFTDWTDFLESQQPDSVNIPGGPSYATNGNFSFSIVFNNLVEFSDEKSKASKAFDTSDLNNGDKYRFYGLSDLVWSYSGDSMELIGRERDYNASLKDQFAWTIKLYVPTKPGRVSAFPKTLYSENSTVFDFVFSNFKYSNISGKSDTKHGRLVLEMLLVHGPLASGKLDEVFSRDDEYTPSVFLTYNQLFGNSEIANDTGFLQWKPISYLSKKRKSTQSQQAIIKYRNWNETSGDRMPSSLVTAMYNSSDYGVVQPVYMVFGTEGDDNNPNPTYVTWTGMLGFGKPPQDEISSVVIITICVGLGVPALLIGLGGIFLVIRRKPWKRFIGNGPASKGYTKLDINDNNNTEK